MNLFQFFRKNKKIVQFVQPSIIFSFFLEYMHKKNNFKDKKNYDEKGIKQFKL